MSDDQLDMNQLRHCERFLREHVRLTTIIRRVERPAMTISLLVQGRRKAIADCIAIAVSWHAQALA
jgi:hypothetical protein